MEKFYLEIPSAERKDDVLEYMNEFLEAKSILHGSAGLERCAKGMSYEEWLDNVINSMDEEYAKSVGWVPASTYLMIREDNNRMVGIVNIRHYLNKQLKEIGGHIGGSIRPTERGKGYAKIQLYLSMVECKKLGINEAMLDCEKSNIKSEKAIKSIGGVFDKEIYDQASKKMFRNYWVDVDEALKKQKKSCVRHVLKLKRK